VVQGALDALDTLDTQRVRSGVMIVKDTMTAVTGYRLA
jgi:hypothetical protein